MSVNDIYKEVNKERIHHIKDVLRFRPGEKLELKNSSKAYLAKLADTSNKELIFEIESIRDILVQPLNITVCQSLINEKHFILAIKKLTELGASKIIPYKAKYSSKNYSNKEALTKLSRWNKICQETAQQCGNDNYPTLTNIIKSLDELKLNTPQNRLFANEKEKEITLKEALNNIDPTKEIIVLIGPEGGFADYEVKRAMDLDFVSVSISHNILKSETAGPAMVCNLYFHFG